MLAHGSAQVTVDRCLDPFENGLETLAAKARAHSDADQVRTKPDSCAVLDLAKRQKMGI